MNGEFDPLGALFLVTWLAVVGFAVLKLFRRPRRNIWDWLLLIAGVVLALVVYVGGFYLYAFVRISLPF
jgi:hypothetical protein